jgi:hypothetical protein
MGYYSYPKVGLQMPLPWERVQNVSTLDTRVPKR